MEVGIGIMWILPLKIKNTLFNKDKIERGCRKPYRVDKNKKFKKCNMKNLKRINFELANNKIVGRYLDDNNVEFYFNPVNCLIF